MQRSSGALLSTAALLVLAALLVSLPGPTTRDRAIAAGADPAGLYSIFVDGGGGAALTCDHPPVDDSPPGFVEPPECDGRADGALVTTATSSFHCVARIDTSGPGPTDNLTGVTKCYTESNALAALTGSLVPTWSDGDAGAPSPPPYSEDLVSQGAGDWDSTGDPSTAVMRHCFLGTGAGLLSPNMIWETTWTTKTGVGTVDIWASQSFANCNNFDPLGNPVMQDVPVTFTPQSPGADKDGDGCTDVQELQVLSNADADPALENPTANCGDDPYNPNDGPSKADIGGTYDFSIVANGADFDTREDTPTGPGPGSIQEPNTSNECYDGLDNDGDTKTDTNDIQDCNIVPGGMFRCKADIEESPNKVLTIRPICYTDYPTIDINPTAAGTQGGDGIEGAPPPGPVACSSSCYLPLDATPPVLSGAVSGNNVTLEGCFEESVPPGPLGHVYVAGMVDALTGAGEIDIYAFQTLADCQAGTPPNPETPTWGHTPLKLVRHASRAAGWDSDRDGCSDQEELGSLKSLGGLRDPYNRWDFFDVPTPTKNQAVAGTDFFALLGRFGSTDTVPFDGIDRSSDPNDTPVPGGATYHPAFDRSAAVQGGLGHQLTQPGGAIAGTDFFSLLAQFGDTCTAAPNPPKSP